MKKHIIHLLSFTLLTLASQFATADNNPQGNSGRQGPPPEAFTACANKSTGDSAQFTGRNGEAITGTCEEKRGRMVLIPDNMPSQQGDQHAQQRGQDSQSNSTNNSQQQRPPQEAFIACENKSASDSAQFEDRDGKTITGTCEEKRGKMVLIPENMQSHRKAPEEAFTVCVGRVAGDTSSFEKKDGTIVTGKCEEKDGKLVLISSNRKQ